MGQAHGIRCLASGGFFGRVAVVERSETTACELAGAPRTQPQPPVAILCLGESRVSEKPAYRWISAALVTMDYDW